MRNEKATRPRPYIFKVPMLRRTLSFFVIFHLFLPIKIPVLLSPPALALFLFSPLSLCKSQIFLNYFSLKLALSLSASASQKENSDKKNFNRISGDTLVISKQRARDFVLNIIIFFGISEPIAEQHSLKTVSLKNEVRKLLIRFSLCLHCEMIFYPFVSE